MPDEHPSRRRVTDQPPPVAIRAAINVIRQKRHDALAPSYLPPAYGAKPQLQNPGRAGPPLWRTRVWSSSAGGVSAAVAGRSTLLLYFSRASPIFLKRHFSCWAYRLL